MGQLRGRKTISRYAVVVDREQGPLMKLVPCLEALGFRCLRVPGVEACQELLERFPKLSWVAVNASELGDKAQCLLDATKRIQPGVSVLWLEKNGPKRDLHSMVNSVSNLPGLEHIVELVDDALRSRFYDDELVLTLQTHTERAFASLGTFATMRESFIKASRARLSDVNAVLTFAGERAAGCLAVSCTAAAANRAASSMFGVPGAELLSEQVADVLGEVTNRIMGSLMPYFDTHGAPVSFGLPLFVGAKNAVLWNKCGAPSLALEFEGAYGPAFVDLTLTEFLPGPRLNQSTPPTDFLEPESCLFL